MVGAKVRSCWGVGSSADIVSPPKAQD
jgi:hypothetical protein